MHVYKRITAGSHIRQRVARYMARHSKQQVLFKRHPIPVGSFVRKSVPPPKKKFENKKYIPAKTRYFHVLAQFRVRNIDYLRHLLCYECTGFADDYV